MRIRLMVWRTFLCGLACGLLTTPWLPAADVTPQPVSLGQQLTESALQFELQGNNDYRQLTLQQALERDPRAKRRNGIRGDSSKPISGCRCTMQWRRTRPTHGLRLTTNCEARQTKRMRRWRDGHNAKGYRTVLDCIGIASHLIPTRHGAINVQRFLHWIWNVWMGFCLTHNNAPS